MTHTDCFMIQNAATETCLHISEQQGEYSSNDIINSNVIWSVETIACDPDSQSQYWCWNPHSNQIVHNGTNLLLTSTSIGAVILGDNYQLLDSGWRREFLCAGNYIEHPRTEECMSVKNKEINYMTEMEELLEESVWLQEQNYLNDEENSMQVVMEQCNISNKEQTWRKYDGNFNSSDNSASFDSICDIDHKHELHRCYNETLVDSQGWMRCQKHGYFVAGIYFYKGFAKAISKIYCCQSPYSYWYNPFMYPDEDHSSITCSHQTRWTSVTESKVECENDEYVRGIKLKDVDVLNYSLISMFECCHPERHKRVYRHCYHYSSIYDQKCSQSGYFVTSFMEIVSPNGSCEKTIKCCI